MKFRPRRKRLNAAHHKRIKDRIQLWKNGHARRVAEQLYAMEKLNDSKSK